MTIPANKYTVLIVDDDPQLLAATERYLRIKGLNPVVSDGALGVTNIIRRHQPDAVVIDLELPAMNGDALARLLQSQAVTRHVGLVLYSGVDPERLARVALSVGVRHVHKSEGPSALYAAICHALADRVGHHSGASRDTLPAAEELAHAPPAPPRK